MRKIQIVYLLVLLLIIVPLSIGCTSNTNLATEAASDSLSELGIYDYSVKEGDAKEITTNDSESHQMIVKMRLLQYDMSPNLEDYYGAYLVDMKNEDGKIITVVVINENGEMKSLLPEDVKSTK
ncbi:MAG: hypothetical protein AB7V16_01165 [Vulcanibacillus sp.]